MWLSQLEQPRDERRVSQGAIARVACAVALAGMAYCHIKDVGMKFDEHVYYMAALFAATSLRRCCSSQRSSY